MKESRNLNGASILSATFLPTVIVQIFLYVINATEIANTWAKQLSMSVRDLYFLIAPAAYFIAVLLIYLFDGGAKDDYTEDESSADIKGSLIYYLRKYLIGDIVIAAVSTLVFTVLHFMGNITPILAFLFSRQAFLFGMIFAVFFIFIMRALSLALAMIFWRLQMLNALPIRIAYAFVNGLLIALFAIPIGAVLFLLVWGAVDLFCSVATIHANIYDILKNIILGLSFIISLPISWSHIYKINNDRKVDFLYETEGYISTKDGIIRHINAYKYEDIVTLAAVYITSVLLTLGLNVPSAFIALKMIGGTPLLIIGGVIIALPSLIYAIYSSQKSWRITFILSIFGNDVRRV